MQQRFLSVRLFSIISFVLIISLISCVGGAQKKNIAFEELTPVQRYKSYTVDSVFDSEKYLKDLSGLWICHYYEKDPISRNNSLFEFNESYAKEFAKYVVFRFDLDTLIVNNLFRVPIQCELRKYDSFNRFAQERFRYYMGSDTVNYVYLIRGRGNVDYEEMHKQWRERGLVAPFYYRGDPLCDWKWSFPSGIIMEHNGYNYYFKKGEPNNEGIVGIPSDQNNRFIVNRIYESCSIEEAAYKLIEDFPYGTEGLLFPSDENSDPEPFFSHTSLDLYATVYDWRSQDELIVRALRNRNCTFVFEFKQMGDDVYVKYWNDVVFPYEEDYQWP